MTRKELEAFNPETLRKGRAKTIETRNPKTGFGEYHYFYRSEYGDLFTTVYSGGSEATKKAYALRDKWLEEKEMEIVVNAYTECGNACGYFEAEMILMRFLPGNKPDGKCYDVPKKARKKFIEALKAAAEART